MVAWSRRNSNVTRDLNRASDKCLAAWGWGGDDADGDMQRWANWFDEVVDELFEISDADELEVDTYEAAIDCCADILQLDVNHNFHIESIVRIRKAFAPDIQFFDWPFDVSHLWDSDDEDEGIFHLEL